MSAAQKITEDRLLDGQVLLRQGLGRYNNLETLDCNLDDATWRPRTPPPVWQV